MTEQPIPDVEITHSEEDDDPSNLIGEPVEDPFPETWPVEGDED